MVEYTYDKIYKLWSIYIEYCTNSGMCDNNYILWNVYIMEFIEYKNGRLYIE